MRKIVVFILFGFLISISLIALTRTYPDPAVSHVQRMTVFQDGGVVRARIFYSIPSAEVGGSPLTGEVEVTLSAAEKTQLLTLLTNKGLPAIRTEEGYP